MEEILHLLIGTLPETNIAPETLGLEEEISFWEGLLAGAMLVSGSVVYPCLSHYLEPK